nr:hypothetical protein [Tanacetum cinerariifolium]
MADMYAPSGQAPAVAPPVCTDDEILPYNRWVQIGKSNFSLNLDKKQSNPIFKMSVDLLMHTNFYRAFTASTTIPTIYIQQFWDAIQYDKKAGNYRCQLDEQWFVLIKDTLREALQITPINNTQAFVAPPSAEVLVDLVNQLGYPRMVRNVSNIVTNDMFQLWKALTTIINLCLTGKTSGFERPKAPVLQILWGIVTQSNIDYAERIWEEFTQSIHTFMEDKRNLQDSPSKGSAAPSPLKTAASTEHQAWKTPDVTLRPFISLTPADLDMHEAMGPDEQAQLLDDEDIGSAHIPTVNLRQDWWKPLEEERIATPEPAWSIPSYDAPVTLNNWASALASDYSPPLEDSLLVQTSDMATFIDWFCKR